MQLTGALVALVLVACSSARGADTVRVAVIGDSLSLNWPAQLQALVGPTYDVDDYAAGGAPTSTIKTQYLTSVSGHCYQALIVMGGLNDFSGGVPLATTQGNLDAIYSALRPRVAGARTYGIALTTPPVPNVAWSSQNAQVPPLNAWIATDSGIAVLDVWAAFGGATPDLDLYMIDQVHPDSDGDAVIAALVADALGDLQ